tara:strand:+ start:515 stop:745 length:231 start_codon:yes stop_codon:yes gene_type:complete
MIIDGRKDIILSGDQFWHRCVPSFNFEYDENQLINLGLKRGFITELKGNDKYKCYPPEQRQFKTNNNYNKEREGKK